VLGKFAELFLFGVAPLLMGLSATAAALPANTIFDVTWLAEDIEGRGVADNVRSTLRIGQDGKINGIGACNNYFSMASVNKRPSKSARLAPRGRCAHRKKWSRKQSF
jgi:heat shock protein HslJ